MYPKMSQVGYKPKKILFAPLAALYCSAPPFIAIDSWAHLPVIIAPKIPAPIVTARNIGVIYGVPGEPVPNFLDWGTVPHFLGWKSEEFVVIYCQQRRSAEIKLQ